MAPLDRRGNEEGSVRSGDGESPIPDGLIAQLDSLRNPIVVAHVRPDADALGSMFAVALTWPGDPSSVAKVSLPAGSLSQRLSFLAEWADVAVADADAFQAAHGFVAVDTAKLSRCNVDRAFGEDWVNGRPLINIDHHVSNTRFGQVNWVDAGSGSASEMVYRLIREAGRPFTPVTASLLYAGIHSDTVGFSLPTTTASALHAAAELVRFGARVARIGEHLCRAQSRSEFDLNRVIYDNTRIVGDGRVAYSTATYGEITGTGCSVGDIDDQVSIPRSVRGIQIAVLLTEGARGKTRLNIRGEAGINVLPLAQKLGGGGHAQAAGAILNNDIDGALARILPLVMEHLDNHTDSH